MSGILLDDAALSFQLGERWDGSVPSFAGAVNFMGSVTDFDVNIDTDKTDTRGAGEGVRNRYHSKKGTIKMTGVVPQTGYSFKLPGELNPVNRWIRIIHSPMSTLQVADEWIGVITSWHPSGKKGDAFMEDLEVDLSPVGIEQSI